jgi:hypothetical protein
LVRRAAVFLYADRDSSSILRIESSRHPVDDPIVIIVVMLLLAVTSGYVSWAFSSLRKARNAIRAAWHVVESANGQRADEVTQVLAKMSEVIAPVHLDALRRAHDRVFTAVGPRGADQADRMLRAALEGAWINAPRSSEAKELQVRCEAATRQIDEAARDYNVRVAQYEKLRASDARRLLSDILGFERESYFANESFGVSGEVTAETTKRSPMRAAIPGMPSIDPTLDPSLGLLPPDRVAFARPVVNVMDMMASSSSAPTPEEESIIDEQEAPVFAPALPQDNPLAMFSPRGSILSSDD